MSETDVVNFSLLLPTKNGGDRLKETIQYIGTLRIPPESKLEVIIIDNSSNDNTCEIAEQYCKLFLTSINYCILSEQ